MAYTVTVCIVLWCVAAAVVATRMSNAEADAATAVFMIVMQTYQILENGEKKKH